ncbi:predicted protein [Naegleria gruberi]|uniref:Predicted protein n=1 Tax=Naegleria gruberi TaxID=5762 RepID=D2V5T3_NAEGR|nr:uncharacterized protein NAEGRDRAFT_31313 [Naegleria gruberi]EFC47708.1 predicted protein [Naegleria gruberi]|eukprot:XP_002680452.1 predicted protein [Naegleria gruberi strain NEG-M]
MSESEFTQQQEDQILEQFSKLQQEYNNFASTVARIELEVRDHGSVISALKELDGDRKCFRVVGGVLVERTIKEVIPAVEGNLENVSL